MVTKQLLYYKKGVNLFLIHPLVILFAVLSVIIVELLIVYSHISPILVILLLFMTFIQIAFGLSVPALLNKSHNTPQSMATTTLHSLKRAILPILLLCLIIFIGVLVIAICYIYILHGNVNFASAVWGQVGIAVLNVIGGGLFVFVPAYFSVRQKAYFSSIKQSFLFTLSHPPFYLTLLLLTIPIAIVGYFINSHFGVNSLIYIITAVLITLLWTFISGVAFLYLEDHSSRAEHVRERSILQKA